MENIITALQIFYAFGIFGVACELSQRIIVAFDECNDMICRFEWYLLPAEIQIVLPLIMQFAQQPVNMKCFGSVACDRDTLKYVSKTGPFALFLFRDRLLNFFTHSARLFYITKCVVYFQVNKKAFSYFMVLRKFYN